MNASEFESVLRDFVREHLSPKEDERKFVSKHYEQIREFLNDRTFLNGSYARHTSTTPVNDLDVVYVLPEEVTKTLRVAEQLDPSRLDIAAIIESLATELRRFYGSSATIKAQPHSVGVYFGTEDEFSIDVVPAVPAEDEMYWVPELAHRSVVTRRRIYRSLGSAPAANWIRSDPKGYISQATAIDQASDGRFRKAAKAIRKWRLVCKKNADFCLKSFHLELAVTRVFEEAPTYSCAECITRVIEMIPDLLVKRQFPDRADRNRYVDEYVGSLNETDRNTVIAAAERAQSDWREIVSSPSKDEVEKRLARFFGLDSSAKRTASAGVERSRIAFSMADKGSRDPGEQFLGDFGIPVQLRYRVKINARVIQDGFRKFLLLASPFLLLKTRKLEAFIVDCGVPEPYEVRWKVKNTGEEARNDLRGTIYEDDGTRTKSEKTKYWGNHYIECYIIKNGVCVAADRLDVPIGPK